MMASPLAKASEEKARQMSTGSVQGVQIAEIVGIHTPLQYNTKASDAVAEFGSASVAASSKRHS